MVRTNNRVALYARFSSDNQRSESIDAQIRAMKAYCAQHNYVIVDTYIDEAKSATTDRRPSFQQMISDSKNRTFDILLVHKLDRFARNRYDSAVYKRELKKNGVQVFSVLERLDDTPESIMLEAVLEGISEYFSQNLSREVMKGMRENALNCVHTGGQPPLGYMVDPETRRLVVNEHEAETVRLIFKLYSEGHGYSYIIDELHREGRLTKNGTEFRKNSLYGILTNPKYQGTYVFNRSSAKSIPGTRNTHLLKNAEDIITVEGGCPKIVETDIYEKVQKRIDSHKHKGGKENAKHNYLLSGKVRCKECGKAMVGNTRYSGRDKSLYITYRCPSRRYLCSNREINRDYLEAYVISLLEKHIFNKKALNGIRKKIEKYAGRAPKDTENVLERLSEVEKAIKNVADAIASGLLSEALITRLTELEAEKSALEARLAGGANLPDSVPIDTALILEQYAKIKETPASPEYKDFICGFIEGIEVGKYSVDFKLKTGLGVYPELDTAVSVKRQEVYEMKKTV